jgi:hypothetical protein
MTMQNNNVQKISKVLPVTEEPIQPQDKVCSRCVVAPQKKGEELLDGDDNSHRSLTKWSSFSSEKQKASWRHSIESWWVRKVKPNLLLLIFIALSIIFQVVIASAVQGAVWGTAAKTDDQRNAYWSLTTTLTFHNNIITLLIKALEKLMPS